MISNKKYWQNRSEKRMATYHKNSDETILKINKAYDKAIKDINEDINNIFRNYQINTGLSSSECRKILNSKISDKELASIKERIRYIKDDDIKKQLYAELNSKAYKARITRLEALKDSINVNTKRVADTELQATTKLYTNNIQDAYYRTLFDIQKGVKLGFNVAEMPDETIQEILKNNWSGEHYSKRIWNNSKVFASKLEDTLISGIMAGHSVKKHITKLKEDLRILEEETIPHLKTLEEQYNVQKEKVKNNNLLITQISDKLKEELFNKTNYEKTITQIKEQIVTIKNQVCDLTLDEYEERIKTLNEQLDQLNEVIKDLDHKLEIDNKLIDVLGDDGLRSYFFKQLLPILNSKINHYLNKFEMAVTLEFDAYMNETIKTGKFKQDYNQFSGGERCRIDMAILLSFFEISKIISNWSCSILIVDEVFDSGVDQSGIEQFISTLYNIVSEENKDLGIYLVSHKLTDVQVNWNDVIEIEKKSLFSELKVK